LVAFEGEEGLLLQEVELLLVVVDVEEGIDGHDEGAVLKFLA
jgi:hypothetical protein